MLDKNSILAADDLPVQSVEVPEWGGAVNICTLGALDMAAFQASIRDADGKIVDHVMPRFLVATIVDENRSRIFSDEDFEALAKKNPVVLNRLFDVAQKLNGIGIAAQEEIAKN